MSGGRVALLASLLLAQSMATPAYAASFLYRRLGDARPLTAAPAGGIALMGGGGDLDQAFRWLCDKGKGGDFLVLRAHGDDAYNAYIKGLCKANSVATLILPDREAALDPAVPDIIREASVIFIAGGDQSNYVNGWQDTPVSAAINAHLAAGKPIGGTSAGLAVLGEFVYACLNDRPQDDDLGSPDVLRDPFFYRVTLRRDFLKTPYLQSVLTDSHFVIRDRMGRSLGFLARIVHDGWTSSPREIAVDEASAVLLEPDGKGTVVGSGRGAYFMTPGAGPTDMEPGLPLSFAGIRVYHAPSGAHFDLTTWEGSGGVAYSLSVTKGKIMSTQAGGGIY